VKLTPTAAELAVEAAKTLAAKERYDKLLVQLMDESEILHAATNPEEAQALSMKLHQDIHNSRRRRAHIKAKLSQPQIITPHDQRDFDELVRALRASFTPEESVLGGLDQLAMTVKECESAGSFQDLLFALVRVYRKVWFENRFGAIEAIVEIV
jgi:hypothetical protein